MSADFNLYLKSLYMDMDQFQKEGFSVAEEKGQSICGLAFMIGQEMNAKEMYDIYKKWQQSEKWD